MEELTLIKKNQLNPKTAFTHDKTLLYSCESYVLVEYKNPEGANFIAEYIDTKSNQSKWKIHSDSKFRRAKPYENGFILLSDPFQLIVIDAKGNFQNLIKLS
jgi:hypothetical protein